MTEVEKVNDPMVVRVYLAVVGIGLVLLGWLLERFIPEKAGE